MLFVRHEAFDDSNNDDDYWKWMEPAWLAYEFITVWFYVETESIQLIRFGTDTFWGSQFDYSIQFGHVGMFWQVAECV